ncbi:GNAT family N-acetyltransferase [Paenibacillus aestuarii]|uniref:GNAT family N-acetyltransferase n=1 Tax=Paenibacillus aestuarii TaxID=516965 RepID=A0ABW0K9K1_9BACL|nr:GNAT family N-acetyltransferase [Paenibacillus aestuarii]
MSIDLLELETNEEILALLSLQIASYQVEAEIIGFRDIPPLKDGIASIREAKKEETFLGYFTCEAEINKLAGAISFSREGTVVTICRMMVHPDYFRRGIARALIQNVIDRQEQQGASRFIVSTGTDNTPAVQLYESFGFTTRRVFTVPPGVSLTTFERPASQ